MTVTPLERYLAAHPGKPRPLPKLRRLTPDQVARLRAADRLHVSVLWRKFKISKVAAWKIRQRITYRDLP